MVEAVQTVHADDKQSKYTYASFGGPAVYARMLGPGLGSNIDAQGECLVRPQGGVYRERPKAYSQGRAYETNTSDWRSADNKTVVRWAAVDTGYGRGTTAPTAPQAPPGTVFVGTYLTDTGTFYVRGNVQGNPNVVLDRIPSNFVFVNKQRYECPVGYTVVAACKWVDLIEPNPQWLKAVIMRQHPTLGNYEYRAWAKQLGDAQSEVTYPLFSFSSVGDPRAVFNVSGTQAMFADQLGNSLVPSGTLKQVAWPRTAAPVVTEVDVDAFLGTGNTETEVGTYIGPEFGTSSFFVTAKKKQALLHSFDYVGDAKTFLWALYDFQEIRNATANRISVYKKVMVPDPGLPPPGTPYIQVDGDPEPFIETGYENKNGSYSLTWKITTEGSGTTDLFADSWSYSSVYSTTNTPTHVDLLNYQQDTPPYPPNLDAYTYGYQQGPSDRALELGSVTTPSLTFSIPARTHRVPTLVKLRDRLVVFLSINQDTYTSTDTGYTRRHREPTGTNQPYPVAEWPDGADIDVLLRTSSYKAWKFQNVAAWFKGVVHAFTPTGMFDNKKMRGYLDQQILVPAYPLYDASYSGVIGEEDHTESSDDQIGFIAGITGGGGNSPINNSSPRPWTWGFNYLNPPNVCGCTSAPASSAFLSIAAPLPVGQQFNVNYNGFHAILVEEDGQVVVRYLYDTDIGDRQFCGFHLTYA